MEPENKEEELSPFEKIMNLNKLGALFLSSDKTDKAISILTKTLQFYLEKRNNKEIPNFFFSNLYCNLAKAHSVKKEFKQAEELYKECILNHSLYKTLLREKEYFKEKFLLDLENILEIDKNINLEDILSKYSIIMKHFSTNTNADEKEDNTIEVIKKFKPNNLNSLSSFADSLVNLAVIFQYFYKETNTAFNMYYLAILCEPDNVVANIDFNNFLREVNLKEKSDDYIRQRINYDIYKNDEINENMIAITPVVANTGLLNSIYYI